MEQLEKDIKVKTMLNYVYKNPHMSFYDTVGNQTKPYTVYQDDIHRDELGRWAIYLTVELVKQVEKYKFFALSKYGISIDSVDLVYDFILNDDQYYHRCLPEEWTEEDTIKFLDAYCVDQRRKAESIFLKHDILTGGKEVYLSKGLDSEKYNPVSIKSNYDLLFDKADQRKKQFVDTVLIQFGFIDTEGNSLLSDRRKGEIRGLIKALQETKLIPYKSQIKLQQAFFEKIGVKFYSRLTNDSAQSEDIYKEVKQYYNDNYKTYLA